MAQVGQLFRYPVKSMQGERVDRLEFTNGSAVGDRQWALVDSVSGVFLSAKRHGRLLEASAATANDGTVVIGLPNGEELEAADPATAASLSEWLGHDVEIRRPADGVMPAYEALADSTDEGSDTVTFAGPSTHFADFADVHVMTTASMLAAKGLHPAGDWDVRRFRPTMVLEAEGEGFVEDEWVGSRRRCDGIVRAVHEDDPLQPADALAARSRPRQRRRPCPSRRTRLLSRCLRRFPPRRARRRRRRRQPRERLILRLRNGERARYVPHTGERELQMARRRTAQMVTAMSSTDSASSQPPSIHWNDQNRLTGW
jgi:hypothetical protein